MATRKGFDGKLTLGTWEQQYQRKAMMKSPRATIPEGGSPRATSDGSKPTKSPKQPNPDPDASVNPPKAPKRGTAKGGKKKAKKKKKPPVVVAPLEDANGDGGPLRDPVGLFPVPGVVVEASLSDDGEDEGDGEGGAHWPPQKKAASSRGDGASRKEFDGKLTLGTWERTYIACNVRAGKYVDEEEDNSGAMEHECASSDHTTAAVPAKTRSSILGKSKRKGLRQKKNPSRSTGTADVDNIDQIVANLQLEKGVAVSSRTKSAVAHRRKKPGASKAGNKDKRATPKNPRKVKRAV